MRSCDEYAWMLSALLDGELSESERAVLLAHLDECEHCRSELADLGAMSALLSPAEVEVPDGFSAQLSMRLRAEAKRAAKRPNRLSRLAPLAACAAVFVVVVSAVQLGRSSAETADCCTSAAESEMACAFAAEDSAAWDTSGASAPESSEEESCCTAEPPFVLCAARTDALAAWAEENGVYDDALCGYCIDAAHFAALSDLLSCSDDWSGQYDCLLLVLE